MTEEQPEPLQRMDAEVAEAKCSVCGEPADGWRDEAAVPLGGAESISERSYRCGKHMENTGPTPLS